jgi:hypothetical protein
MSCRFLVVLPWQLSNRGIKERFTTPEPYEEDSGA